MKTIIDKIVKIGKEYFVDNTFTSSNFDSALTAQLLNLFN